MDGKMLANASAIDRSKTEFYPTPTAVTLALAEYFDIKNKKVMEPACGQGHMSKILEINNDVYSSDLYDYSYGEGGVDFLSEKCEGMDWVITNPPFNVSSDFIKHAYSLGVCFAFLLKSQYWHASGRTKLFKECRPSHVLALNWRPDFHFGKKGGSPTMECLWTAWTGPTDQTFYDVIEKPKKEVE